MKGLFLFFLLACGATWGAAEKVGTIDWANRAERPAAKLKGYLPEASAESQGGDSEQVAAWVKALDEIGDLHGFVLLRHGRLVAEGYWAPYERAFPHALNGLAGVMGAALLGAQQANGNPVEEAGALLDALTAKDPARQLEEAFRLRNLVAKRDVMYYEQAVSRRCLNDIGFTWEYAATPGDGAGRKTTPRNLARIGQLHLRKGDWFGKRIWTKAWAERYYRFFSRPSGMKVASGERGQILAVVPKADLVLAVTADTAETERILTRTETLLLPAFGDAPRAENPSAAQALSDLCASLRLPEVGDVVSGTAQTGVTYDLPANRYGMAQFRLARSAKGCNLELKTGSGAQMLPLAPASRPAGGFKGFFTFVDTNKGPLSANGRYRIAATGGWQTPTRYVARVYLTEVADRFDYTIELADPAAPVFTVTRGREPTNPVVLKGRPAEKIGGVARVQNRAEIIWTRPIRKAAYIGWPTVMRRRSGELIACYSGNREAHVCPYGRDELIRSFDGGETWTTKPEIFRNSIVDDRDCGIVELRNGDLLAAWFSSTCFAGSHPKAYAKLPTDLVDAARGMWTSRSTDGGRTWEPPVGHRGSAPHGAIQLRDGRLLFVGMARRRADTWNPRHDPEGVACLMVEESRDDGRSWRVLTRYVPQKPFLAPGHVLEPYPVETTDGRILVFCRCENLPVMTQVESTDGGRTWGPMSKTPIQGYPPHFLQMQGGRLLCSYVDRTTLHEMAVVSDDQGRTWDVANGIFLSKGPTIDMGYPSTVENADGTLLTVYYQSEKADEPPCLMATKWRLLK